MRINKHQIDKCFNMNVSSLMVEYWDIAISHTTRTFSMWYAIFFSSYTFRENANGTLFPELSIPGNNSLDSFIFTWNIQHSSFRQSKYFGAITTALGAENKLVNKNMCCILCILDILIIRT